MTDKRSPRLALSLLGLVIVFIVAFGLDRGNYALGLYAASSFDYAPLLVLMALGNLLLAGCLIVLAWYVDFRGERSRVVASLFLIVGGLMTLYPIAFALGSPAGDAPLLLRNLFIYLADTQLHFAAAFVSVIGLISLVRRR